MAPKARRAAKAKGKAAPKRVAGLNERNMRRRAAVRLLNGLAEAVGLTPVLVKSASPAVEALAQRLEPRCQANSLPGRLGASVEESGLSASAGLISRKAKLP